MSFHKYAVIVVWFSLPALLAADDASPSARGLGDPGTLKSIAVETANWPNGLEIAGRDSSLQLVVTGQYTTNQTRDLTADVQYETSPVGIVDVASTGLVTPRKEGLATISIIASGNVKTEVAVTVTSLVRDVPVNFANQVVPIFTKFGCNSGGCHGKAGGQNGFMLSLLGFEAAEDYEHLVKEGRGRRLQPAAPDQSLLLRKSVGATPHGGGKRLDLDSPHYRVIRRWIEQGTPVGRAADPIVERIEVSPRERILDLNGRQQLSVVAHFNDGSTADVTRMAQFESNQAELAEVSETGLVTTGRKAGVAAVMVRFQIHVDVFRATVPLGAPMDQFPPAKNFIDELVFEQLKRLTLPPSAVCDDSTFIRRASIDIAGRLPTQTETEQFLADSSGGKHDKLVDRLLASDDYADYFANKWSAILRNRRRSEKDDSKPTFAFHAWIRDSLRQNKPYDKFVREILTATGEEVKNPTVVWYREVNDVTAQLEDTAQLLLGQRIQCARCHHHPFEKWSQDDYYGLAAFFSQLEVKDPPAPKKKKKQKTAPPKPPLTVTHKSGAAQVVNPKTGLKIKPTGLGSPPLDIEDAADPRDKLVDWMADKNNPFFGRTLANRYWKHFFGRGLVDPEDDMRATNPPTNPKLLDALSQHFIDSKFDMKALVRAICTSQVYRLSSVPNEFNADDRQNYSRYAPKRLHAEVLLDAVDTVTATKTSFKGVSSDTRAVQLPDNQFGSYFLSVFGRPDSASACECERSFDASLAQMLHLFNSKEILDKVNGNRARDLAKDKRPHEQRLRDIYLVALSREPTEEERNTLLTHIEQKGKDVQTAYADIIWAVINSKEFLFNH